MLDFTRDSLKLVIENKLFLHPVAAYGKIAIGALGTAVLFVALAFTPIPLWVSGVLAGFAGGYVMPYLFRDVKFL